MYCRELENWLINNMPYKNSGRFKVNRRVLYNAQKAAIEEVKQELLKRAESERQRNVIKEVCNNVARKHRFDDTNGSMKSV